MMIATFDDLITAFNGPVPLAARLGLVRTAIPNWRKRGRVPPGQWPAIVDAAQAAGIDGVSYDVLRHLQFPAPPRPEAAA